MKKYVIAFIFAVFASSAMANIKAPAKMGTMVSDLKPTSIGTIHDDTGVGELQVNESARMWRYMDNVTTKHPNRAADIPFFGNN